MNYEEYKKFVFSYSVPIQTEKDLKWSYISYTLKSMFPIEELLLLSTKDLMELSLLVNI